jgi:hypothetical protein
MSEFMRLLQDPTTQTVLAVGAFAACLGVLTWFLLSGRRKSVFLPILNRPADELSRKRSAVERRQAVRRAGNPVAVLLTDHPLGSAPVSAWVVDRSRGGLGVQSPRSFAPEITLAVRAVHAPEQTRWTAVRVLDCVELAKGHWMLHCAFVETPPWNVLLLFG